MSIKLAEFLNVSEAEPDTYAREIAYVWDKFNQQRRNKIEEWKETRNYVFATDTTTTSNQTLPWKNKTTLPKLCQIRDNLHSNYISALFPSDDWLHWEGASFDDAVVTKRKAIEGYMSNKLRNGHFRTEMSKCLYDYIDYGNVFATPSFEARWKMVNEEKIPDFIGPRAHRISPLDIVFNPTASSFKETFKIIRSIKTVGELKMMAEMEPDNIYLKEAVDKRNRIIRNLGQYSIEDNDKAEGFSVDGFGNLQEYYQSGYVEILEFWGDFHNSETGEVAANQVITVVDRSSLIRKTDIPSWLGHAPIYHAGWRSRPDNLWSMGPLDNLTGLQYRIDHLENLKADAMDIAVFPPLVVKGEVEQFQWGPGAKIFVDDNGGIDELGKNLSGVMAAENQISALEQRMELYAGAPREAMGMRTPGEKTAFEVQTLENAAGRIFQEKINHFEIELLEPLLNAMLETSVRNMDANDVIRVMDDDLGVQSFMSITREDITAQGQLRPIGARHFAAQSQLLQNLNMVMNSPMAQTLAPHISSIALAKLVEDALNIERYGLFSPNQAVHEQKETQRHMNGAEDALVDEQVQLQEEGL